MERKVIYISPDYSLEGYELAEIEQMTSDELLTLAKNENFAAVYSLDEFQCAFNSEEISDLGFIFFVSV